jgi:hypothetical protein
MAYRLPSERVELNIEDGPTVEVERVQADLIYQHAVGLTSACLEATTDKARAAALSDLYPYFVGEAQPTWAIVDHRGAIPPTLAGIARLPFLLGMNIVIEWLGTHAEKSSAVDELIPPSPLRDKLNATLKAKRAARKAA